MTATSMSDRDGVIWFDGKLVPWLCSQTDLLATDWVTVEG